MLVDVRFQLAYLPDARVCACACVCVAGENQTIQQLFTEVEVARGGYLPNREAARLNINC